MRSGDLSGAEAEFLAALAKNPRCFGALCNLGFCLVSKGDFIGAEAKYRVFVEMAPYDPTIHYNLGCVLELIDNPSGAVAEFRAAIIECAPEDHAIIHEAKTRIRIILDRRCVESLLNFGVFLHSEGDLITAEAMYRRAMEIDPNEATVHFKLGVILEDGRDVAGAEAEFRAAIGCDSGLLVAHLKLAEILQERGDVAGADVEFRLGMSSEAATQVFSRYNNGCLIPVRNGLGGRGRASH